MRKALLIVIGIYANSLLGQVVIFKDSLLDIPVEGVNLSFKKSGVASDQNGEANISIFNNNDIIEISHVSYYTKKIAKKNANTIIYLTRKTNILPSVTLAGEIKMPLSKKHPIFTIKPVGISLLQTSITSLLSAESEIVVQESQSGGGSPNYRGMEASRLLLILDGIALNNAIYRSGHVQSSATINPFFINSIRLLSGPASATYGNGAMGGALVFDTHEPAKKTCFLFCQQFESSSLSRTTSFKANYHARKLSYITALSVTSSGNLKMGGNRSHGYDNWGKEATVQNEQLYTNYMQADFLHKTKYKINPQHYILLNTQYSTSSNIYRFDKMNDIKEGLPKYQKWYYGPQSRFFQSIYSAYNSNSIAFDNIGVVMAFQDIKESRHAQPTGDSLINNRKENVKIYDFNVDFNKAIHKLKFAYGIGARNQKVLSTADLSTQNSIFYNTTRYPDGGSSVQDFFAYSQINFYITKKLDLLVGGRWNKNVLTATFNNPSFSFKNIETRNSSFVRSALISFVATKSTTINASYYGGFRNPNIDDVAKIFSKDDINIVVPNINLEPEYADNLEFSFNYTLSHLKLKIQLFNTQISNAITREYGTINGADSMIYDGEMMRVQMNKNIESASIKGLGLFANFYPTNNFSITANCNFLKGRKSDNSPLAHIPPFNAKVSFTYQEKRHAFNISTHYNAWKLIDDYDEAGVDNLAEATINGNPSWFTLNLAYTNKIDKNITFVFAIKNILDTHYKTFASGLSASGRNFIFSFNTSF